MANKSREEVLQYTCSKRLVSKCPPKCLNVAGALISTSVITRVVARNWVDHTLIKLPSKLHWLMSQKLEIILVMERSVKHDSSRSHWLRGTTKERQVWAGKRLSLFVKFSFNWRYREERNIIKCCKDKSYKLLLSSIQNFHCEIK